MSRLKAEVVRRGRAAEAARYGALEAVHTLQGIKQALSFYILIVFGFRCDLTFLLLCECVRSGVEVRETQSVPAVASCRPESQQPGLEISTTLGKNLDGFVTKSRRNLNRTVRSTE